MPRSELSKLSFPVEIATHDRSNDQLLTWPGFGLLPDPDLVARRKGYDTAQWVPVLRFLQTDPHVWACCQSRKAGTLSLEWELLEPDGNQTGSTNGEDQRAYETILAWLKDQDIFSLVNDMLDAAFFGMSPIEIIWRKGPVWLPERLTGKPPEWFSFTPGGDLCFLSREHPLEGEALPPKKFLLPRHNASYINPFGERLLSRCYWPVTFKRAAQKYWSISAEKYGVPWVVGKVPRNATREERTRLLAALAEGVQDNAMVLNDDEMVEFLHDKSGGRMSSDMFAQLVMVSDSQISKAILGQTLTTEPGPSGSYALGQVQSQVRRDLLQQDRRMVRSEFNKLLRWICSLNYTRGRPPVFSFFEEDDTMTDRAQRDLSLSEALERSNLKLSRRYFETNYKLRREWLEPMDDGGNE